jgi:hypothetical protein
MEMFGYSIKKGYKVSPREYITSLPIKDGKQIQLHGQLVH